MPALTIRIKKNRDGTAALSCTRADGSVTWQKQTGQQARFFPLHDLTHYAVESVLGHRNGFYGMVADGWDLSDFGAPWPRGPLPVDIDPSELIVGFLDTERASGTIWTAADLEEKARLYFEMHHIDRQFAITDEELGRIRQRRGELFAMWNAVPPGDALELRFDLSREDGGHM
ncbi:MAG TPA: hypothetical protein VM099_08350 [Gemmatimonadaceae bacterium]|nr:hypothetical protein [Gemmatimonadaceae bacterium]